MSTDSGKSPTLSRRRRVLRLGGLLIVLLLVPVLFAPRIIQYALPWYLQHQGLRIVMSAVDVDFLDNRVTMRDLRIGPRSGLALKFREVGARLNLRTLIGGEFPLEDLQLQGGELDLEALQRSALGSAGDGSGQPFTIPRILIKDFKLKWLSKWLEREVVVKRLFLEGLEAGPQADDGRSLPPRRIRARVELQARVGRAELGMEGELGLRGEKLDTNVSLRVRGLDLSGFEKILAIDSPLQLAGRISADTRLKLSYNPNNETMTSRLSGTIDADGLKFKDKTYDLALNASYQGELGIDRPVTEEPVRIDARGLLSITELGLKQRHGPGQDWSLKARGIRYQGGLKLAETLEAKGSLQSDTANLRLESQSRDISVATLQAGIDYKGVQDRDPLAVLTALQARELQIDSPGAGLGAWSGQDLAVEKLTVNKDYSTLVEGFSAAGLGVRDRAGPAAIQLSEARLAQLRLSPQGALLISVAGAESLEASGAPGTVLLRRLEMSELQREEQGPIAVARLAAERLELKRGDQSLLSRGVALTGVRQYSDSRYSAATLELQSLNSDLGAALEISGLKATDLDLDAEATLAGATLAVRQLQVQSADSTWTLVDGRATELKYAFTGDLNFGALRGGQFQYQDASDARISIDQPRLDAFAIGLNAGSYQAARIRLAALSVTQPSPPARLASGQAELQGFAWDTGFNVSAESLAVSDLQLGMADPPQLSLASVDVTAWRYRADDGLSLGKVKLLNPDFSLVRSRQGDINVPRLPFVEQTTGDDESTLAVRVSKLTTQGKPSINFSDRSVKPAYVLGIKPFSLQLADFDTKSDQAPGNFKLTGQTSRFTNIDISGKARAGSNGMNISLAGKLTGMALENLSPYTGKYEKFAISKGRGDLALRGTIRGGELDLQTQLVISKLELEPFYQGDSDNPEAEDGSGSLAAALMLLSDNKQTVRLIVPVTGTLSEPRFDFSDARTQAIAGAAKGAVLLAFRPFGILMSAAKQAVSAGAVDSVLFAPGGARLRAESISMLDDLAAKLKRVPELKLQICGRVVKADIEALAKISQKELVAARDVLAQSRSRVVSNYLAQKHLVAARQLKTACTAQNNDDAGARPRAELKFDIRGISVQVKTGQSAATKN